MDDADSDADSFCMKNIVLEVLKHGHNLWTEYGYAFCCLFLD